MKKLFLIVCLYAGLSARAQFSWGVQGGVNISDPNISADLHFVGEMAAGFQAGVFMQMRLFKSIYFRPAVQFINKSYKLKPAEYFYSMSPFNAKYSFNYISIPLLVTYQPKISGGNLAFGLGPDLNFAVSGKGNLQVNEYGGISNEEHKLKFGKSESDEFRSFVIHALLFAGYQSNKGLGIHLFGSPIYSYISSSEYSNALGTYGVSLTYLVGRNNK